MRWITNTYDPTKDDAPSMVLGRLEQTTAEKWRDYQQFLAGKVIGRPKATATYSVAQLEAMSMVGVYVPEPTRAH